ncbi:hypothetical protein [Phytoactinopolyspora halotolerans]|uniref:DUF1440 domain-containing protein n=1 Tax=Phytoactinopolyspora halotolerans TaxID=1981512 RepID=A0A6L9SC02_9ACTN|nr:hypothetical protein [Phytoactinopolyspora halotolerans]NEE02617.1 hypothetical protein [Phytoactinopolyspora halotolerans]
MADAQTTSTKVGLPMRVGAGIVGGLVGGVGFGILMQAMGMMPMVADLINSSSEGVGWLVHLFNSALFGAIFVLLFFRWIDSLGPAALLGLLYGVAWWLVGALWIMPAWLGMDEMIFEIGDPQWQSFVGHLFYGLLLAVVYVLLVPKLARR